jgi:hypothetical protein
VKLDLGNLGETVDICIAHPSHTFSLCRHIISFWGIDSGVRHSVGGSDYESVRVGTFMGMRIASEIEKRMQVIRLNRRDEF